MLKNQKDERLSRDRDSRTKGAGLLDFAGLQAPRAHEHAADRTVCKTDFHALQVREKTAAGNSRDLFTDTAGFFGKTAPGNGSAHNRFFIAEGAVLHKGSHYSGEINLGKGFFLLYT